MPFRHRGSPVRYRRVLSAFAISLVLAPPAAAVLSGALVGKGIATALDMRSIEQVKADTEIDAALTTKLATQKGDDFNSISALVFAGRVVLVGFAPTPQVRNRAEAIARAEGRYKSLKNEIIVASPRGDAVDNAVLEQEINAVLTGKPGIASVNMRWKAFGGDVFLMGVARSRDEAEAAVQAIRTLHAVRSVHSALDVIKS